MKKYRNKKTKEIYEYIAKGIRKNKTPIIYYRNEKNEIFMKKLDEFCKEFESVT